MSATIETEAFRPRRRARAAVAVAILLLLGLASGLAVALLTPTSYQAEARVAVGQQTLATAQVPGYAAALETLAENYARYVQDTQASRKSLSDASGRVTQILSTPIPGSAVIRIVVTASSASVAQRGANELVSKLISQTTGSPAEASSELGAFEKVYRSYRDAQAVADSAEADLARLKASGASNAVTSAAAQRADSAEVQAASLNLQQEALGANYRDAFGNAASAPRVTVLRTARFSDSDTAERAQRSGLLGLAVGALAAAAMILAPRILRSLRMVSPVKTSIGLDVGDELVPAGDRTAESQNAPRRVVKWNAWE